MRLSLKHGIQHHAIFLCIVVLALVLRLYRIQNPVADWHSFRQADTASVTREFLKHGIDVLKPTYHDLSNIQSGKENPEGYRMVEFPIVNAVTAGLIKLTGMESQQVLVGRIVSVAFSLVTIIALYALGNTLSGRTVGLTAAGLFAILPYSVYYSRVILPEPAMLAMSMLALACAARWVKHKGFLNLAMWTVIGALALLIKPPAVFLLPVAFAFPFVLSGKGKAIKDAAVLVVTFVLSGVPLYFWREWITKYPEGIPASDWLLNEKNLRFTGAFFHWIFDVRIATLILGIGLVGLASLGLLKKGKDHLVYLWWGICMFAYLSVFAGGNIQHDYYQVMLLPFLVLAVGRGVQFVQEIPSSLLGKKSKIALVASLLGFSLFVSWYQVRGYFNVNRWELVEAGAAVDKLTPKDAKIIAPYMGDTAFLFQTNRKGWPIGFNIDQRIEQGATYYITVNKDDEANELRKKYKVIDETDRYLLIDLTSPTQVKE